MTKKLLIVLVAGLALTSCTIGRRERSSRGGQGGSTSETSQRDDSSKGGGDTSDSGPVKPREVWWETVGDIKKDSQGKIIYNGISISIKSVTCGHDQMKFEQLVTQFNNTHPGITVSASFEDQLHIDDNAKAAIMNQANAPDLILTHQKTHQDFFNNRLIQPLDEAFEYAEIELDSARFSPSFAEYADLEGRKNGSLFTIPLDAQSNVMLYNKRLLAKYNLELPKTRAEYMNALQVVQAGERAAGVTDFYGLSCATDYEFYKFYTLTTAMLQNGAEFYDPNTNRADWTNDKNKQAFRDGCQALRELKPYWDSGDDDGLARAKFAKDKALFYITLPFDTNELFSAYTANKGITQDKIYDYVGGTSMSGFFALDSSKPYAQYMFGDSHAWMMSTLVDDITKKAAIAEFVNWFTTTVQVGIDWANVGHISAYTPVRESTEYKENKYNANFNNKYFPDLSNFRCPGRTPYYSLIFPDLYSALVNASNKTKDSDIDSILRSTQTEVNNFIDLAEDDY